MARAHIRREVRNSAGALLTNLDVRVLQPGTTTLYAGTLYTSDAGVGTLANPFVSADGVIDFYIEDSDRVRLGVQYGPDPEFFFDDVDVLEVNAGGAPYAAELRSWGGNPQGFFNANGNGQNGYQIIMEFPDAGDVQGTPTWTYASSFNEGGFTITEAGVYVSRLFVYYRDLTFGCASFLFFNCIWDDRDPANGIGDLVRGYDPTFAGDYGQVGTLDMPPTFMNVGDYIGGQANTRGNFGANKPTISYAELFLARVG